MQNAVILAEKEWRHLPVALGVHLANFSRKGYGFKIVLRETGEEVDKDLMEFLVGVMSTVFAGAVEEIGGGK